MIPVAQGRIRELNPLKISRSTVPKYLTGQWTNWTFVIIAKIMLRFLAIRVKYGTVSICCNHVVEINRSERSIFVIT